MPDYLTTPLFAFISILRSNGAEELKDIAALKSKMPARIRQADRQHVVGSCHGFLSPGAESLEEMMNGRNK
ncbi:MAG TPA: hypothetical protein VFD58_30360 [Blastocatellia bacterium]|nr:hypothetical protein [Blastocatellia bacterium]